MQSNCEWCMNYCWNDEIEAYECAVSLDEDEMTAFLMNSTRSCPWFRMGDEYKIVQKQN